MYLVYNKKKGIAVPILLDGTVQYMHIKKKTHFHCRTLIQESTKICISLYKTKACNSKATRHLLVVLDRYSFIIKAKRCFLLVGLVILKIYHILKINYKIKVHYF